MSGDELCAASLSVVAGLIERREVSPVEVTAATLERIERLEPDLNAFITVMADEALAAARLAESEIGAGTYRGPLHGVPVSLKDLYYTRGVRTTAGSRVLRDFFPSTDATVTMRLRQAGAIIVGKNNMAEFAYGETHPDHGDSHNPWNLEYGTNGSSGGSAAAVAAGLGYGSMGSDTGGSIRLPAAFCGVVGIKPTYGRVSRAGVVPLSWSLDHAGPITRNVRDNAMILSVVAGFDEADATSVPLPVPDYAADIDTLSKGLRVGVISGEGSGLTGDVRASIGRAVALLEGIGCEARPVEQPYAREAVQALFAILYPEASTFHLRWLRKRPEDYTANTRERLELGALLPGRIYVRALRARQTIARAYARLLSDVDVLLTPAAPFPSYRLDSAGTQMSVPDPQAAESMSGLITFSGPFDLTGLPALSVPVAMTGEGLPIGVQFVGRPFAEPELYKVAHAFEQTASDWRQHTEAGGRIV